MSLYLIDYENVREKGFEGVEKLTGRDEVIIFYSEFIKNLPFQIHVELMNSKANMSILPHIRLARIILISSLPHFRLQNRPGRNR